MRELTKDQFDDVKNYDDMVRQRDYAWMSDDQWYCFLKYAILVGGYHHIRCNPKKLAAGIELNISGYGWSTWDFSLLTRAVIMAHDHMIRLEIKPSGPNMLKICMSRRHQREGDIVVRHPTIEEQITEYRRRGR